MQTIRTKYLGATDHKPAGIMARIASGDMRFFSYDYGIGAMGNHRIAAMALASALCWRGRFYCGYLDVDTYVWVRETKDQFEVRV